MMYSADVIPNRSIGVTVYLKPFDKAFQKRCGRAAVEAIYCA
jgi:hypothetical protein